MTDKLNFQQGNEARLHFDSNFSRLEGSRAHAVSVPENCRLSVTNFLNFFLRGEDPSEMPKNGATEKKVQEIGCSSLRRQWCEM